MNYPKFRALNPFFELVMKGLTGLVDGDHYFDAVADNARLSSAIIFPVGL
jgi:hypothetical protein